MALTLAPLLVLLAQIAPHPEQQVGGAIDVRLTLQGASPQAQFGKSLDAGSDIDGDGVADILVGADLEDPSGVLDAGSVFVYSGADGSELLRIDGPAAGAQFGHASCFVGDMDGDGVDDILIGAPGVDGVMFARIGAAWVHSGADGSQIHFVRGIQEEQFFGTVVSAMNDLDGDGTDDFAVASEWFDVGSAQNAGRIEIFSGADASPLLTIDGSQGFGLLGSALDSMPDMDGDTVPDLLVGERGLTSLGRFRAGSVQLRSGADGSVILSVSGASGGDQMGSAAARLQDLNGDGLPEFVAGAHNARSNTFAAAGEVRVFDGATGGLLFPIGGRVAQGWFGYSVADAGDVNGDGIGDILVGATLEDENFAMESGSAYVFSGRDRDLLFRVNGDVLDANLGFAGAAAGDLDGDGHSEIVVSAAGEDVPGGPPALLGAGAVRVYDLDPFVSATGFEISQAAGGDIDILVDFPASEAGLDYMLLLSARPPGVLNFQGFLIPLQPDSFTVDASNGNYPPVFLNPQGLLDANGDAVIDLVVPPGAIQPGVIGALFRAAVISGDMGSFSLNESTISVPLQILP